jgi:hypothetical protein
MASFLRWMQDAQGRRGVLFFAIGIDGDGDKPLWR